MSEKTLSEVLFERACDLLSIKWQRVPEDTVRTPDYKLTFDAGTAFAEVTQLDPTPDDKKALAELERRGSVAAWTNNEQRIRRKISYKNPQLKLRSGGLHPGLLVLYCNTFLGDFDQEDMHAAMFGSETYVPVFPDEWHAGQAEISGPFLGTDGEFKENRNTSTSAVVSLRGTNDSGFRLWVFHNKFARVPFNPDWLRSESVRHLVSELLAGANIPQWRMI